MNAEIEIILFYNALRTGIPESLVYAVYRFQVISFTFLIITVPCHETRKCFYSFCYIDYISLWAVDHKGKNNYKKLVFCPHWFFNFPPPPDRHCMYATAFLVQRYPQSVLNFELRTRPESLFSSRTRLKIFSHDYCIFKNDWTSRNFSLNLSILLNNLSLKYTKYSLQSIVAVIGYFSTRKYDFSQNMKLA